MIEHRELRETLREVVEGVLGAPVRVAAVEALPGVSHRSFRIVTDRGVFAVKLREAGAANVLGLADEHGLHERVAAAGLASAPVGFDAQAGALVTRYVERAAALIPAQTREPAMIGRLARLIDALHGVPADDLAPFAAEAHARRYVGAARRARSLDEDDRKLAAELIDLGVEFDARDGAAVLCHADLIASNVLDSGRLWLIDFEYAAAADPVLDLASLAAMNRFGARERRELLDAYASVARRPWAAAEFDRVVRLLRLLAYFWADAEAEQTGSRGELDEFRRRDELLIDRDEQ